MPRSRTRTDSAAKAAKRTKGETAYRAPALEKGLAILELLAGSSGPASVADIAAALGRSRPEIYRTLIVLESLEYIHKTEDGRCDLTGRMFDIAIRHTPKRSLVTASQPVMEELSERTLQSCHLMISSGDHMVCIAREESPAAIGFAVQVGFRPPVLQSTSGRVYFAFQNRVRQDLLVRRLRTRDTVASELKTFIDDAKAIAEQGYALEPSRLTAGIQDISAPIFGTESNEAIGCLTVPFISHRLFSMTLKATIPLVREATTRISHRLQKGTQLERGKSQ